MWRNRRATKRLQVVSTHLTSLLEEDACSIVVIGASVFDVHLQSDASIPGSTVPGTIRFQHGGVGRNMVECLAKLKHKVLFISVVGDDIAGKVIVANLDALSLPNRGIKVCKDKTSPLVACSFDARGQMIHGVADTSLFEQEVDRDWIYNFKGDIENAKLLLIEANLSQNAMETCTEIAYSAKVPIFYEPVSVSKSSRIVPYLSRISMMSPNLAELAAIADAIANGKQAASKQAEIVESVKTILSCGVDTILVTKGEQGVDVYSHGTIIALPALKTAVVNVNGAGDCFVAGLIASLISHSSKSLPLAVSFGIATASEAVISEANVPESLDVEKLKANASLVLNKQRTVAF